MNTGQLVRALAGTQPVPVMVVKNQTVPDIMSRMLAKHAKCLRDYDKIYRFFLGGDLDQVCNRLWAFCRKVFIYQVEGEKAQYVSSPLTMLLNKDVDCKNYALFIGGVLDAIKRNGAMQLDWEYRFASYQFLSDPGHVFIVVNPKKENLWVDPVLDYYNDHAFYFHSVSKKPVIGAVSFMPWQTQGSDGAAIGARQIMQLAESLDEYVTGLQQGIGLTNATGTINAITMGVLNTVALCFPIVAAALLVLRGAGMILNNSFGVGSAAARIVNDISQLNFEKLFQDIFKGRTYGAGSYELCVYFKNYVQGVKVYDTRKVADADVALALKWFIDRTGVYIQDAVHIWELCKSPEAYIAISKTTQANAKYITTDYAKVAAASRVAKKYWASASLGNGVYDDAFRGKWADTLGVYDDGLIQLANSLGMTAEQYVAKTGVEYASHVLPEDIAAQLPPPVGGDGIQKQIIPGVENWMVAAGASALLLGYAFID